VNSKRYEYENNYTILQPKDNNLTYIKATTDTISTGIDNLNKTKINWTNFNFDLTPRSKWAAKLLEADKIIQDKQ
jgi:hypothetical protein